MGIGLKKMCLFYPGKVIMPFISENCTEQKEIEKYNLICATNGSI